MDASACSRMNIEPTMVKKAIDELMNVTGMGEKSFLKLKPLITVGDSTPATHQFMIQAGHAMPASR